VILPTPTLETLRGVIERITFYNEENGYLVARFVPEGKTLPVTIVGNLLGASVGESYTLEGTWVSHPEYGRQFEIKKFALQLPATIEGLKKYLGSGLIKGIGPVTAERIVKHFGMSTLDIIEQDIERLSQVEGVGPKRIEIIRRGWAEQKQIKEVMLFLASHGVSTALAVKIYKAYGNDALNIVQREPYRLARDIYGIGFLTADKIARAMGIKEDDPARIEAGIRYVLSQFSDDGHCFAPRAALIERARETLTASEPLVAQAITMLSAAEEIIIEPANVIARSEAKQSSPSSVIARSEATKQSPPSSVIARSEATKQSPPRDSEIASGQKASLAMTPRPDDAVYLAPFYYAEIGVANRLKQIQTSAESRLAEFRAVDWHAAFDWLASKNKIALTEKQQRAIQTALTEKISILTGGPGTGKTTTVRALLQLLKAKRRTFKLAAPTGRAAKRLSEATGEPAQTLHRLLEFKPFEGYKFLRDRDNPLDADLIIVDELSMIDILLMNALVKAVNAASHLLLIGDPDQLPSVGAGNVLKDLIASQTIPVTALDVIFRQAQESLIIENAHRINRGQMPEFTKTARDFFLFTETTPESAATRVVELVKHRIPRKFGMDAIEDIQVLAPMHRGIVGVGELNRALQDALNPAAEHKPEWRHGSRVFRLGDKVMQTRNNYAKQVFNGDLGRVVEMDAEEQRLVINFDGARVEYEFSEADELVHAFALSVHKSQGSEYRAVVIPLLTQHYLLLQRNLLYTAVTRAKELVVLVGTLKAISIAIRNNKVAQRNTRLAQRLSSVGQ